MIKMKIKDICDLQNGRAFKPSDWGTTGLPIIRIQNLNDERAPFNYYSGKYNLAQEVDNGDLLFSWSGTPGTSFGAFLWNRGKGVLNQHIFKIIPKVEVEKTYLMYALNGNISTIISKAHGGVGLQHITKKELDKIEIQMVSISRQKEIVEILEKVSLLIFLRKQQLAKLDELVKARFVEMFGDVISNSNLWPICKFSEITSSRLGKMLDAKQQTGVHRYPYLANFNVQWFRFELKTLNGMDFNESDRIEFELHDGDLLVCEGGEIGRCAVWHNNVQPCYFQKALHRVRCNKDFILPDFLAWWFKYNCDHGGFSAIEGAKATIAHLPGAKLKNLDVCVPPLSLQNQFAAFVERVDQQKQTVQQSLEKLELMKKALMQEYFG